MCGWVEIMLVCVHGGAAKLSGSLKRLELRAFSYWIYRGSGSRSGQWSSHKYFKDLRTGPQAR